jgi:hypothetical protein
MHNCKERANPIRGITKHAFKFRLKLHSVSQLAKCLCHLEYATLHLLLYKQMSRVAGKRRLSWPLIWFWRLISSLQGKTRSDAKFVTNCISMGMRQTIDKHQLWTKSVKVSGKGSAELPFLARRQHPREMHARLITNSSPHPPLLS